MRENVKMSSKVKSISVLVAVLLVVMCITACNSNNSGADSSQLSGSKAEEEATSEEEQIIPRIKGMIRQVDRENYKAGDSFIMNILVVEDQRNSLVGKLDAANITIDEDTIVEDVNGNSIKFEDIKIGMYVTSYDHRNVEETYPSLMLCSKLIVEEHNIIHKIEEVMTKDEAVNRYSTSMISAGYYPIGQEFTSDMTIDGLKISMKVSTMIQILR